MTIVEGGIDVLKKKMKKIFTIITMLLIFIPQVNANCDSTRVNELRSKAKNIEITYELNTTKDNKYDEQDDANVNDFGENVPEGNLNIIISGLTEEFEIKEATYNRIYRNENSEDGVIILKNELNGARTFKVYSIECNKEVRTIFIKLPRYNIYSTDPLCEGISGKDLSVCDTWYEKEIDYETFKKRVEEYKTKINNEQIEDVTQKNVIDLILDFFKVNYIYFIVGILTLIFFVIFIKIKRKRSVLE